MEQDVLDSKIRECCSQDQLREGYERSCTQHKTANGLSALYLRRETSLTESTEVQTAGTRPWVQAWILDKNQLCPP